MDRGNLRAGDIPGFRALADPDPEMRNRVEAAFARCFSTPNGTLVIGYLRAVTKERVLGAQSSDTALRQLEGQRQLVQLIENMIVRGSNGSVQTETRDVVP